MRVPVAAGSRAPLTGRLQVVIVTCQQPAAWVYMMGKACLPLVCLQNAVLHLLPTTPVLPAESRPMGEADEDVSDGAMPQLPASVHVRKSSVACSKVRPTCEPSATAVSSLCASASDGQSCHAVLQGGWASDSTSRSVYQRLCVLQH